MHKDKRWAIDVRLAAKDYHGFTAHRTTETTTITFGNSVWQRLSKPTFTTKAKAERYATNYRKKMFSQNGVIHDVRVVDTEQIGVVL